LVAIFANFIAPYDPEAPLDNVTRRDTPCIHALGCTTSQGDHPFGIDGNNRDELSRIIYGARLSLQIGLVTTGFAIVIGSLLGAVAGYTGGWTDTIIMRFMDIFLAFPSLLLAIAIVAVLGRGLLNALIAIAIVNIPVYARLFRASVLAIKDLEYVTASRSIGATGVHVLKNDIVPNAVTPILVQGTLGIATTILDAAGLSFLGLGAQPPTPEWGAMLSEERNSIFSAPHLVFIPGIAIMLTVLSFNLIGDALRDALDPRLRIG
jgi:ABC-type dipeptide/oligopeptide/nickel transport system permease subunit